ncbi:MAG: hypothetical protein ACTSU5_11350 [Promethearchaeota archaeon]
MAIKRDFEIRASESDFRKLAGNRLSRMLKSARAREDFEVASRDLLELADPRACWRSFPVRGSSGTRVTLGGDGRDVEVGGGRFAKVVRNATEVIVAVCTIGPAVEEKIHEYATSGKAFRGTLLDGFASWAVHSTRRQLFSWLKRKLHAKEGLRVSVPVGPGEEFGFPLQNQRAIFDLLAGEVEAIGVSLTDSLLMVPLKSVSLVLGVGSEPLGRESGYECEGCNLRATCKFRHLHGEYM